MAGLGLNWQDFMRRPEIKVLLKEQGMVAVKQRFAQEQNKMMWNDPIIIQENTSPGASVNNSIAAAGSSTPFTTGNSAQVTTLTFPLGLAKTFTASIDNDNAYFDVTAYDGSTDFSANHEISSKTFRFFLISGSTIPFTPTIPSNIDGVVTASAEHIAAFAIKNTSPAADKNITGSILGQWDNQIRNQSATFTVAGFTNTIAPSALFTSLTGSAGFTDVGRNVLQITNKYRGDITDATIGTGLSTNTTASIATATAGTDTYFHQQGVQVFDGMAQPFSNMPRKDDGLNTTSQSS